MPATATDPRRDGVPATAVGARGTGAVSGPRRSPETTTDHDVQHGAVGEYVEARPHPALRDVVTRYTGMRVARGDAAARRRELPSGEATIIVCFAGSFDIAAPGAPPSAAVPTPRFLTALSQRPAFSVDRPPVACVEAKLSPHGVRRLIGGTMHDLGDRVVPLDAVLGPSAERLADRLAHARGWPARFALLDALLLERLAAVPEPPADLTRAWARLVATGGGLTVAELARELSCSRRLLAMRFREHVGLAPSEVARVLRFDRARRYAAAHPGESWAAVAAACGYADQPHLHREVRRLAGVTPGELRPGMDPETGAVLDAGPAAALRGVVGAAPG